MTEVPGPPADPAVAGYGFSVALPVTWEARIFQRPTPTAPFTASDQAAAGGSGRTSARAAQAGTSGWLGEQTRPVLHLANFPLPVERGDYGSGAVEIMGPQNLFIALLEFGRDCLGSALYSQVGLPRVSPDRFDPNGLQRRIPGQSGCQVFFTEKSRPMCLYVVLGSHANAAPLTAEVNMMLDRVEVAAG